MRHPSLVWLVLLVSASSRLAFGAYTVIDLTPTASSVNAGDIAGGKQVGTVSTGDPRFQSHAMLFSGSAASAVDLHPAGFAKSSASGTNGAIQVGVGYTSTTGIEGVHALMWRGTASSVVDLHPVGFRDSYAADAAGDEQVGGYYVTHYHAALWHGTASSKIDLHPAGFADSDALATSGTMEVGQGIPAVSGSYEHALLWRGTAASAVDLTPSWAIGAIARDVAGNQEVGEVFLGPTTNVTYHAALWTGTAESAIDLQPAGYLGSQANGTDGVHQVGTITTTTNLQRAVIWSGTADSMVFLPTLPQLFGYTNYSASAIDEQGNILGRAATSDGLKSHMIMWAAPEPGILLPLLALGLGLLSRKRR